MVKDTGVSIKGESLKDKHILFAITGGIAATESIKVSRELRRYGAKLTILMSKEAEKIITPLAISWASNSEVNSSWNYEMSQLEDFDLVLVAPATRNTISKHVYGILDSPIMMALSAARSKSTPTLFIPSMHLDLFDDPVTTELIEKLNYENCFVLTDSVKEGKIKQLNPVDIVARASNIINSSLPNRKKIAITLGANRAPIDSVRAIQNASSGKTGWIISEYLYRNGHDVICIVGKTSERPNFNLPDIRLAGSPQEMLHQSINLASEEIKPDAWIHAAAVLDYFTEPEKGKRASEQGDWEITLTQGPKHIAELMPLVGNCTRIGFKLESNVKEDFLIEKSINQISRYNLDAVIGNIKEQINDSNYPRARIIDKDGSVKNLKDYKELCEAIESVILSS
ncbi:MAG: bifunctional phosphopantothenoylcysteine decarboxylase/phosphopantothenate--cysteine ligase CoaBC [Euryarchaeota archaeon]|nr:bifunctional phosphopantothenoylcysteine decarboxylase/phosphopantothenate--cysteine ligase CoaBC [Euryarchaeota archaeon]|tara:strand:+ start:18344 stop:19537 length:1194 start_codon:yes stop_codon:yes gene_type:complete